MITSIIIFFGIIMGLGLGLNKISKTYATIITLTYVAVIFIILLIVSGNISLIYNFNKSHIYEIIGFLGVLTFICGILTINNWKNNKETNFMNNFPLLSSLICCFVGTVSVFTLLNGGESQSTIETVILVVLGLISTISISFISSKLLKKVEKPYPIIISNFMILIGFYFLMFAAFIPNIGTLSNAHMNPLYLNSTKYVFFLVIAITGIFLCGVFIQNLKTQDKKVL